MPEYFLKEHKIKKEEYEWREGEKLITEFEIKLSDLMTFVEKIDAPREGVIASLLRQTLHLLYKTTNGNITLKTFLIYAEETWKLMEQIWKNIENSRKKKE